MKLTAFAVLQVLRWKTKIKLNDFHTKESSENMNIKTITDKIIFSAQMSNFKLFIVILAS